MSIISFFLLLTTISAFKPSCNSQQELIDFFLKEIWSESGYSNECSGHQFTKEGIFYLYENTVDIPFYIFQLTGDSVEVQPRTKVCELSTESVHLTDQPLHDQSKKGIYYMRISPIIKSNDRFFQVIWVKGGYFSSGFYYLIDTSKSDHYKLEKAIRPCDDWG